MLKLIVIIKISAVILFLVGVNPQGVNAESETLHLGVLISQEGGTDLSGYIPAMNMALETIENDTTLPFNFSVRVNDSKVSFHVLIRWYAASCSDVFVWTLISLSLPDGQFRFGLLRKSLRNSGKINRKL